MSKNERKPHRSRPAQQTSTIPATIELPKGQVYDAICARVVSRDESGRPWELRLIYPEDEVEVVEGDLFLPIYVDQKALARPEPESP
jgi:hypothetical protein